MEYRHSWILDICHHDSLVIIVWHFVRYGIEVRSKRTKEQLRQLADMFKKRIDEIRLKEQQGGEFPAKPMILCNWCYYWQECPAQIRANPFIRNGGWG